MRGLPAAVIALACWAPALAVAQQVVGTVDYYAVVANDTSVPEVRASFFTFVAFLGNQPRTEPACAGGPPWVYVARGDANFDLLVSALRDANREKRTVHVWATPVTWASGTFCKVEFIRVF
jgi:hypothetical protein